MSVETMCPLCSTLLDSGFWCPACQVSFRGRFATRQLTGTIAVLEGKLDRIRTHWQEGAGVIDTPWKRRMSELLDDHEGLAGAK